MPKAGNKKFAYTAKGKAAAKKAAAKKKKKKKKQLCLVKKHPQRKSQKAITLKLIRKAAKEQKPVEECLKKGVAKYRRDNPGSKLKTAVTTPPSKLKKGSKAAKRRKSFCARSKGWKSERGLAARRKWNC